MIRIRGLSSHVILSALARRASHSASGQVEWWTQGTSITLTRNLEDRDVTSVSSGKSRQYAVLHPQLFPCCRPVPLQASRQGHVRGTRWRPHQLLRHRWHCALGGSRHRLPGEDEARLLHGRRHATTTANSSGAIYQQTSGEFAFRQANLSY